MKQIIESPLEHHLKRIQGATSTYSEQQQQQQQQFLRNNISQNQIRQNPNSPNQILNQNFPQPVRPQITQNINQPPNNPNIPNIPNILNNSNNPNNPNNPNILNNTNIPINPNIQPSMIQIPNQN